MLRILMVCTGNICRSPLAELLLRTRLADLGALVSSAGTRAAAGHRMTAEARHLAVHLGVPERDADAHRSQLLTESQLADPDLILAMTRDHRRAIVELAPARVRSTFTLRELARIASGTPSGELARAVASAGADPSDRLRMALSALADRRAQARIPVDPDEDDVVDPYGLTWAEYQRSATQILPAIGAIEDLIRATLAD